MNQPLNQHFMAATSALAETAQHYLWETSSVVSTAISSIRNPLTNAYTTAEYRQLASVQDIYQRTIDQELPDCLQLDASRMPLKDLAPRDFLKVAWLNRLGTTNGVARRMAEDMISKICSYQIERRTRPAGGGYDNDPCNLVLHEFKEWVVTCLACQGNHHDVCEKRICYVNELLSSRLFPPGVNSVTTMEMVLLDLRKKLEEIVLPILNQETQNEVARENFIQMLRTSKLLFYHGVIFLYFIFRSTPETPTHITLELIRKPTKIYSRVFSSTSGRCLRALVRNSTNSEALLSSPLTEQQTISGDQSLVTPRLLKPTEDNGETSVATIEDKGSNLSKNMFFSKQNQVLFPHGIVDSDQSQRSSGVVAALQTRKALHCFLRMHGLLFEWASLTSLVAQAHDLAGLGGDLLVYHVVLRNITQLFTTTESLLASLENEFLQVASAARAYHEHLITAKNSDNEWRKNYSSALEIMDLFKADLKECVKICHIVLQHTSEIKSKQQMLQSRAKVDLFSAQTDEYCEKVTLLLNSERNRSGE
eukprot:Lithocolla_globosa_v1_NODE_2570_length_1949_cov_260.257128.p1 type:complete len:535 gc:universal NODE_2570_length_1949_cov_260.257128:1705-101(-)